MRHPVLLLIVVTLVTGCGPRDEAAHTPATGMTADSSASPAVTVYEAAGTVKSITPNRKHMVVDHGDIPGFMSAMQMPFALKDTSLATGIAAGDSIRFSVEVEGPNIRISGVEVVR